MDSVFADVKNSLSQSLSRQEEHADELLVEDRVEERVDEKRGRALDRQQQNYEIKQDKS